MTNREIYVLGWVYGRIARTLKHKEIDTSTLTNEASMRPFTGWTRIHTKAMQEHTIDDVTGKEIGKAVMELSPDSVFPSSTPEPVISLEQQGVWQLAYYCGISGNPLPSSEYSIIAHRQAMRMSQAELAEKIGADQAQVSRWERGVAKPTKEQLEKIKRVLGD